MGDMADYLNEQLEAEWYEGEADEPDSEPTPTKTCRCCGRAGLQWALRDGKWRLHDQRGIHVCPVKPLKEKTT